MVLKLGSTSVRIDVGGVVFLTAMMAFCVWYLFDARAASLNPQNLVLIQPAVIVAAILYVFILRELITFGRKAEAPAEKRRPSWPMMRRESSFKPTWSIEDLRIVAFIAVMAAYVFAMIWLPFDLSTFAFIVASLLLQGERGVLVLLLVPLIFTALVVYMFKAFLSIPVPTLFGS